MLSEKRYLVWFGHNNSYFNHRFREFESVSQMLGLDSNAMFVGSRPSCSSTDPYAIVRLPSDEIAIQICKHAVLTRLILELWGCGENDHEVIESVKGAISDEYWSSHLSGKTFGYKVIGYGIQHTDKTRRDRMSAFGSLFKGYERVDMRTAGTLLYIIDEHDHNFDQTGTRNELIQAAKKRTFYGRLVAENDNSERSRFALSKRAVLGPTSLDNDLAFIMANMAEIKMGSFVCDPFCGTGGLLITASAKSGGCVPPVGTDIDVRVLRGEYVAYIKNRMSENMQSDIFQNFKSYNLPMPEIFVSDNNNPCWRMAGCKFDVILTDPPYGVRAGAKKIGAKFTHEIENRDDYYPQMLGYQAEEVNLDLLRVASTLLVENGILVFLLHVELIDLFLSQELRDLPNNEEDIGSKGNRATKIKTSKSSGKEYVYANECAREKQFLDEESIIERVVPKHPDLITESAVLQILAAGTGRVLVKMRKRISTMHS